MFRDSSHSVLFSCFFNFIIIFFSKFYSTSHQAIYSGWFRLKGKSRKTSDIISTKSVFFFNFGCGGAARDPPPAPWVRPCDQIISSSTNLKLCYTYPALFCASQTRCVIFVVILLFPVRQSAHCVGGLHLSPIFVSSPCSSCASRK
jgi:hypothetical protein